MSDRIALNYEDLYYIRTRGPEDKRPMDKWGGYGQDFDEASQVFTHDEVQQMPDDWWAIVGVDDTETMSRTTLIFDLDVHKAPDDFDVNRLDVAADTLLTKSQNGGFHLYFTVQGQHQDLNESDFQMTEDLGWDIDIRGSAVGQHVVAPTEIPGVDTPYEIIQDETIKNVLDPADAAERVRCDGEPLLEFSPTNRAAGDYDIDRDVEPPEEMPTCYHRGLQLREASPDEHPNSHKVNVLTALCGLYAGYSVESVTGHFLDYAPDNPDQEKTEYQVQHLAEKIDLDQYSPPAISTLRNYGILDEDETCDCEIPYHGGDSDDEDVFRQTWEWWSNAREHGEFGEESIIPDAALWHIAGEYTTYPVDEVPDDHDGLPLVAARKALGWLNSVWADRIGIDTDEEDVTKRQKPSVSGDDVLTWDGVRYIYENNQFDGRYAAVQLLRSKYHFLTPEDTEDLHVYDEDLGIYDSTAKYLIGRELDRNLGEYYSQHEKREIIGRLKEVTVERRELEAGEFDANLLCVKNGVLDVDERTLLDHDPKYQFTTYLPVEYDETAVPEGILRFLRDITKRDADARTLLEVLGHTLLTDYDTEWKHLFLILFGEGSNGKSTWYDIVRAFLNGPDRDARNVESLSLQKITDNRFAASSLVGKWANIGEDLPQKKIHDPGMLKDLTGGGETWVEPKGEQGFNFSNRATMMFAANRPPILGERTTAIKRRLVPIHLPYEYTSEPDEDDPYQKESESGLVESLTTDEELSGLLNAALAGIDRLGEQKDVSLPESNEERLELYERYSDHIKAFRVDCLKNEQGSRLTKDDIYNAYTNFCNGNDYTKVAASTFWKQLRQTTLNVTEIRLPEQDDGNRPRALEGVTFEADGLEYAPEQFQVETGEEEAEETAPTEQRLEDRVTAIKDLDTDGNPYRSVTVEVTDWSPTSDEVIGAGGPAETGTVKDETGPIDVVDFFGTTAAGKLEPGECFLIEDARVSTYDGTLQLEIVRNTTEVTPIQSGVGYTEGDDPDDDQGQLADTEFTTVEAASDGGTEIEEPETEDQEDEPGLEGKKAIVNNRLATHYETNDTVTVGQLAGEIEGLSPSDVESGLTRLAEQGTVQQEDDRKYRLT